jgi:hypothetical protein
MALWGSFIEAGRWHDIIGGMFCIVAGTGILRSYSWGTKLGLVMTAGYLNLLAYLCLMFFSYSGILPDVFFGMPLWTVRGIFATLLLLHFASVVVLWRSER